MSTRTNSHYKTSTSKIINILDRKELSFQQLSQSLHTDEEVLSRELNQLIRDDVVARKFRNHNVTYARIHYPRAMRLLHKIESQLAPNE